MPDKRNEGEAFPETAGTPGRYEHIYGGAAYDIENRQGCFHWKKSG
ncbi:MAG TPA: hypothetical protein IAA05_06185 [Candidatus Blautia excrementipullorum]|nr:hypothetical protein [Candidatus Blautia excrementipullorum]